MDFITAVGIIQGTIKRPDKASVIKSSINRTISLYNKTTKWAADHVELSVSIDASLYAQSFSISDELANFRSISYIRPEFVVATDKKKYLNFLAPDQIFLPSGREQLNVWYRSGANIIFKVANLSSALHVGYWRSWPYLVADTDENWMLADMFEVIHDKVCAAMYTDLGNDVEARKYEAYALNSLDVAKADLATGVDLMTQSA